MNLWIAISTPQHCHHINPPNPAMSQRVEVWCTNVARWEKVREPGDTSKPVLACNFHLPADAEKELS